MCVTCRHSMARRDGANGEHGPYKRLLISYLVKLRSVIIEQLIHKTFLMKRVLLNRSSVSAPAWKDREKTRTTLEWPINRLGSE
jgi:hypothetical protein